MSKELTVKGVVKSFVEDLRAGRDPEAYDILKNNPELAEEAAPIIHLVRLKCVTEDWGKPAESDPEKIEASANRALRLAKKTFNERIERELDNNLGKVASFRENKEESDGSDEKSLDAIKKWRKEMFDD